MRCPICKKPVELASELAPFCSERCRLLDLGNWASERYVIRTPLPDIEDEQEAPDTAGKMKPERETSD